MTSRGLKTFSGFLENVFADWELLEVWGIEWGRTDGR
jgi:hypothetical protein